MSEGATDATVRFGEFVLDGQLRELRRAGQRIALQRKPMALLWYLIRHRERVVPGRELLDRVWPDVHVGDQALAATLRDLRKALSDTDHVLIQTLRGHGYRFTAEVHATDPPADASEPVASAEPLLGREVEMQSIRAALTECRSGDGRACLLLGPAGIGKTRITDAVMQEARAGGFLVHAGSSPSGHGIPPFWPWIQVVRSCMESAVGDAESQAWLRAAGPALQTWLPDLLPDDGAAPELRKPRPTRGGFEIADSLVRLLAAAARTSPRLVVLEDLHAADPDSLAVLEIVAQSISRIPVLLLSTLREDDSEVLAELRHTLAVIRRTRRCESLTIGGLRSDEVRALLSTDGADPVPPSLVARVCEVTGGNPLFVTELARLYAQGRLSWTEDGSEPIPVPPVVRDALELQLGRRSAACQETLRAGSVSGDAFSIEILRRVLDVPREAVLDALSEAEAAGLIRESPTSPGLYGFRHSLWQECLYDGFTKADVRRLHLRTGEALEAVYARDLVPHLSALARHFAEAAPVGGADKAVQYAQQAAERSQQIWALRDSARHYRRALDVLELVPHADARLRSELHIAYGLQLQMGVSRAERKSDARAAFEAGVRLAREAHAPDLLARALAKKVNLDLEPFLLLPSGTRDPRPTARPLEGELREALDALPGEQTPARTRLLICLSYARFLGDEVESCEPYLREAEATAAHVGDPELLQEVLVARWWLAQAPDALERREAIARQMCAIAQGESSNLRPDRWLMFIQAERGELTAADAPVARLRERGGELPGADPEIWHWCAMRATMSGRFDEAERYLERLANVDGFLIQIARGTQEFWLRLLQGRTAEVIGLIETAGRARAAPLMVRLLLVRCYVELDRRDEAIRELRACLKEAPQEPFGHEWIFAQSLAAEALYLTGEAEPADSIYQKLRPFEDRTIMGGWMMLCLGSVARPLGLLAASQKSWDVAVPHLERALEAHLRLDAPPFVAQTRLELARVLRSRGLPGDAARAHDLLREAEATAARLGMRHLETVARAELDRS